MNRFLVVTSKIQSGERKRFPTYEEALQDAKEQLDSTGFGRFTDLMVVEVKAVVAYKQRTLTELEVTQAAPSDGNS
jgi:hypothetical protein